MVSRKPVSSRPTATKRKCIKCQREKADGSYYLVYSDIYGDYTPICKKCANELFKSYVNEYGTKGALILISSKLDMIVFGDILEKWVSYARTPKGESEYIKGEFLDGYISDTFTKIKIEDLDTSACSFEYSNFSNYPFNFIPFHPDEDVIGREDGDEDTEDTYGLSQREIRTLTLKWGDFEPKDLAWLENEYAEWNKQYELFDKSQDTIIRQVCLELLEIKYKRNNHEDASDNLKMVSSLLNTSKLSPKKQVASKGANNISSFSELTAMLEERGPIKHSKQNEDVDKMHDLMIAMAGAIARTARKPGPLSEAFEEVYADYTIDMASLISSPFEDGEV